MWRAFNSSHYPPLRRERRTESVLKDKSEEWESEWRHGHGSGTQDRLAERRSFYVPAMGLDLSRIYRLTSGADRDRTGDPLLAKQVLSQLSYRPEGITSFQLNQGDQPAQEERCARLSRVSSLPE